MIIVEIDTSGLSTIMREMVDRIIPDVAANALNRSAQEVQERLQQEVHLKFNLRTSSSAQFMTRMVKIAAADRANRGRLQSAVRVEAPEASRERRTMLTRHIAGGVHSAGSNPFFIPTDALRADFPGAIPRGMYPSNLRLMDRRDPSGILHAKVRVTRKGILQPMGSKRTFVLIKDGQPLGVYQRHGGTAGRSSRDDIDMIWSYKRSIKLRARYPFFQLGDRVAADRLAINFQGMLDVELRKLTR